MEKNMNPVGWFEIPATDLDRAEAFYTNLFGFAFDRQEEKDGMTMSWFPMTMNAIGAAGTLIKGDMYTPSHEGTLVYFSVPHVEEFVTKATEAGAKILFPTMSIGEHGFVAWIEDSEGNRIAVHSMQG